MYLPNIYCDFDSFQRYILVPNGSISIFLGTLNWNCNYSHTIQRIFKGIFNISFLSLIRRIKQKQESVRKKTSLFMDRTFISHSQIWVTIYTIILLKWGDSESRHHAVCAGWMVDGKQKQFWVADHRATVVRSGSSPCIGCCICTHLEIMKPFSLVPLTCSISIISLKRGGQ